MRRLVIISLLWSLSCVAATQAMVAGAKTAPTCGMWTSPDGGTWTDHSSLLSGCSTGSSSTTQAAAGYGGGEWVFGSGTGQIYSGTDPTSAMTLRTSPFASTTNVAYIVYDGSEFLACGWDSNTSNVHFALSANGTSWSSLTISGTTFGYPECTTGNGTLFVRSQAGTFFYSTNHGSSWTSVNDPEHSGSVYYIPPMWNAATSKYFTIAGTAGRKMYTSTDYTNASNWSAGTNPPLNTSNTADWMATDGTYYVVLGTFHAGGDNKLFAYSTDASNWTDTSPDSGAATEIDYGIYAGSLALWLIGSVLQNWVAKSSDRSTWNNIGPDLSSLTAMGYSGLAGVPAATATIHRRISVAVMR